MVIDRGVSAPGHGNSIVDALSGIDKNAILRLTRRKTQSVEDSLNEDSKEMKIQSYNDVGEDEDADVVAKPCSAAEHVKIMLDQDGNEGVKSEGKNQKREQQCTIRNRCRHVRHVEEDLSNTKCGTILIGGPSVGFSDMFQCCTCHDVVLGHAALRVHPCNFDSYDRTILLPWEAGGVQFKDQPRFQDKIDCDFYSALSKENKWHFIRVEDNGLSDDVEKEKWKFCITSQVSLLPQLRLVELVLFLRMTQRWMGINFVNSLHFLTLKIKKIKMKNLLLQMVVSP